MGQQKIPAKKKLGVNPGTSPQRQGHVVFTTSGTQQMNTSLRPNSKIKAKSSDKFSVNSQQLKNYQYINTNSSTLKFQSNYPSSTGQNTMKSHVGHVQRNPSKDSNRSHASRVSNHQKLYEPSHSNLLNMSANTQIDLTKQIQQI